MLGCGKKSRLARADQRFLVVRHYAPLALGNHAMPLGLQAPLDPGDPARVLGVQFAARFQGPPVGCDPFLAFGGGFFGGIGCNPGEDAGGDWLMVMSLPRGTCA